MNASLALRIIAATGMLAWVAAAVANAMEASLLMVTWLSFVSAPYLLALVTAWAKDEFMGAMLASAIISLAAQIYVQVELYLAPPDGQKGFVVFFLVFAQTLVVLLAAACAEALESHRKNRAERAGSDGAR
ncbi:MAG TPA: hypothetical protein VGC46_06690 [Allosphingosinicella sp.]